jgi:SAM-dependent methyltransferase
VRGVDPSPGLIERARALSLHRPSAEFLVADGGSTPLAPGFADAVVLHTVLSHAPDPPALLAEAHRLLGPEGSIVVFDGDYATLTFATGPNDPLDQCASAFADAYINDPHVMRRAAAMLRHAGFTLESVVSHGFPQIQAPDYLLSVFDRGAQALTETGLIGDGACAALQQEARRRIDEGTFFGFVAYVTMIGRRR